MNVLNTISYLRIKWIYSRCNIRYDLYGNNTLYYYTTDTLVIISTFFGFLQIIVYY